MMLPSPAPQVKMPYAMPRRFTNHMGTAALAVTKTIPIPTPLSKPCVKYRCQMRVANDAAMFPAASTNDPAMMKIGKEIFEWLVQQTVIPLTQDQTVDHLQTQNPCVLLQGTC